jgi:SPP1 family predicted phage head-tail adaptor
MSAGRLSERLTIVTATPTADSQGGQSTTSTTVDTVWAELVPVRAAERLQAQGMGSQVDYRFRMRVRADVSPTMTVRWTPRWPAGAAEQVLQIAGILYDQDRAHMTLDCGVRQ